MEANAWVSCINNGVGGCMNVGGGLGEGGW